MYIVVLEIGLSKHILVIAIAAGLMWLTQTSAGAISFKI